ncbi:MAG: glucose-6-phosphate isomerase [Alphaproteobacteria bacterium]
MRPVYEQDIRGCLADTVGEGGVSAEALATALEACAKPWGIVREALVEGDFPPLGVVREQDDLADITATAARLAEHCDEVAVIGVGGSSLGAEALTALAANPRTPLHFLDNSDPESLARFRAAIDPARTGAVVVSKSGGTAETLALAMTVVPEIVKTRSGNAPGDYLCVITEPGDNPLHRLANHWGAPVLNHDPDIGGRFSVFSCVGMLPAALAGLDIEMVRSGAADAVELNTNSADGSTAPAVIGAAISMELLRRRGARVSVIMPYADALAPFARWHRQLWAESLGKNGRGTTPIDALGAVDQHSQLQLYLDGPDDKMFTVITQDLEGRGARVPPDLAKIAGADYLAGHATGDLLAAEQEATIESLLAQARPVRRIAVSRVDEAALGALMAHFMLETVMAAFLLGVDAFDQPAVEDSKVRARARLKGAGGGTSA